jgi:hypothetical protein
MLPGSSYEYFSAHSFDPLDFVTLRHAFISVPAEPLICYPPHTPSGTSSTLSRFPIHAKFKFIQASVNLLEKAEAAKAQTRTTWPQKRVLEDQDYLLAELRCCQESCL